MKEVRTISKYDVRRACISKEWYTCGDCKQYDNMLNYVDNLERVTTDELETIATDIKHHSDTDYDIKQIMYILANDYCLTFIED